MQDETDVLMEKELDYVAYILENNVYYDYCRYEDDVATLVYSLCPECTKVIKETTIGITPLWTNIRNYIRFKGNISFDS